MPSKLGRVTVAASRMCGSLLGALILAALVTPTACGGGHGICIAGYDSCYPITTEAACGSGPPACVWQPKCLHVFCDAGAKSEQACTSGGGCQWVASKCYDDAARCEDASSEQACSPGASCSWTFACRVDPGFDCSKLDAQTTCEQSGGCDWTIAGEFTLG